MVQPVCRCNHGVLSGFRLVSRNHLDPYVLLSFTSQDSFGEPAQVEGEDGARLLLEVFGDPDEGICLVEEGVLEGNDDGLRPHKGLSVTQPRCG